jgi:hypothetical protein
MVNQDKRVNLVTKALRKLDPQVTLVPRDLQANQDLQDQEAMLVAKELWWLDHLGIQERGEKRVIVEMMEREAMMVILERLACLAQ